MRGGTAELWEPPGYTGSLRGTMPYIVFALSVRGEHFTPDEFRAFNEDVYIPVLRDIVGPLFPRVYARRYIARHFQGGSRLDKSNDAWPAVVRAGSPEEFSSDLYTEMEFATQTAFEDFVRKVQGEVMQAMREREDGRGSWRDWPSERYIVIDRRAD